MSPREPAERQLERILHILPLAAREGGASISALAEDLGVPEERIVRDLGEVLTREPPLGEPVDVDLSIQGDRVTAWTRGEFRRPVKLSPGEALALALGLRVLGREAGPERAARFAELAGRLDAELAAMPAGAATAGWEVETVDASGGRLLALLRDATRTRRPCRLEYLKPDSVEPEPRAVHPYVMVYASGHWYVLGEDPEAGGIRAFRLDRILEAAVEEGAYEVPPDFDAGDWIEGGGVFLADTRLEARVRYSLRVAPWIREADRPGEIEREEEPGGALVVRHRVADPGWLVRHVLAYGPEAELLEPAEMRALVAERVALLAG